jgi:hypothetical protein
MLADAAPEPSSALPGVALLACLRLLLVASAVITVVLLARRNRRRS